MQSAIVSGFLAAIKNSWPILEPLLLEAGKKLIAELVALAKAGGFSAAWKWLEPIVAAAGDELIAKLPAGN